jgi:hypothetical protein
VQVQPEAIEHVRQLYAPAEDSVFELVPPVFDNFAKVLYQSMGSPSVTSENVWDIYRELLFRFEHLDEAIECVEEWEIQLSLTDHDSDDEQYPMMEGQRDLLGGSDSMNDSEGGDYYMGGVNNGMGLGLLQFTD